MINLAGKPFNLDDTQIEWVKKTISDMTTEEKIRQLFILLDSRPNKDDDIIRETVRDTGQGGLRWQGGDSNAVYVQNISYQKHSKYPLLIAANCDDGGSGAFPDGTFIATAAQAAAGSSDETAYHMGLVAGREAGSVGCNWMFNPVVDIYLNWRNSIVNTRCFGDNADTVLRNSRAFIRGIKDAMPHMAVCAKHFPGDGVEELDHHLVMGVNHLEVNEWMSSFGKVYSELIQDGIESVMIGHFAFPAMSRKLKPGLKDSEILPATISPEIITGLLREELGFQGVVLTDATHMIGLSAVESREKALPLAVAAGCDMILFANDFEEDAGFIRQGLQRGVVSEQRLDEAVTRILGLKAKVRATEPDVSLPPESLKVKWVGCDEHRFYADKAADECTTLVKDSAGYLPVDPAEKKRALLVYVPNIPNSKAYNGDPVKDMLVDEFERVGFQVTVFKNFHDLELENGPSPMNFVKMLEPESRADFKEKYDVVFLVINVKGYAQENNVRLRWSIHHSKEMPWYIPEVPTIAISLNYTNHLIDIPQVKTMVNAYAAQPSNIRAAVEKICGKSGFKGKASSTVFCDRWETRL